MQEKKEEEIEQKASYCLNCKVRPCSLKGCPLGNHIPDFIQEVKNGNYENAYDILRQTTVLPGVCGRICPHQKQCQGSCVRGIKGDPVSIGDMEAFVFDEVIENNGDVQKNKGQKDKRQKDDEINAVNEEEKENEQLVGKKVAVVGGGPAGLTCAAFLARKGVEVTIYEKYDYLGGLLRHGIPEFRLPKDVVDKTIKEILEEDNSGKIEVKYGQELGKNLSLSNLEKNYDAIFLAIGANKSSKMGVEGEELQGVFGGNELLEHNAHPDYSGKVVSVIGGGNVAMDCARTIQRMGAKQVNVIYRRAEKQMPAEEKEVQAAKDEGVQFLFQNNIVKIIGNGNSQVEKLELIKTELVKREGETREVPVNIEGSNYQIETDFVVMALGGMVSDEVLTLGLTLNKWGNIYVDEKYQSSNHKIFAGGDLAGVKGTVAWASRSGRDAAYNIGEYLLENE